MYLFSRPVRPIGLHLWESACTCISQWWFKQVTNCQYTFSLLVLKKIIFNIFLIEVYVKFWTSARTGHAPVHYLYTDEPMSPLLSVGNLLAMSRFFSLARELLLWTGERSLVQINTTDSIGPKSLQTSKI
jgi:hypothetical protein